MQWVMSAAILAVGMVVNAFEGFPPFQPLAMLGGMFWAIGSFVLSRFDGRLPHCREYHRRADLVDDRSRHGRAHLGHHELPHGLGGRAIRPVRHCRARADESVAELSRSAARHRRV